MPGLALPAQSYSGESCTEYAAASNEYKPFSNTPVCPPARLQGQTCLPPGMEQRRAGSQAIG